MKIEIPTILGSMNPVFQKQNRTGQSCVCTAPFSTIRGLLLKSYPTIAFLHPMCTHYNFLFSSPLYCVSGLLNYCSFVRARNAMGGLQFSIFSQKKRNEIWICIRVTWSYAVWILVLLLYYGRGVVNYYVVRVYFLSEVWFGRYVCGMYVVYMWYVGGMYESKPVRVWQIIYRSSTDRSLRSSSRYFREDTLLLIRVIQFMLPEWTYNLHDIHHISLGLDLYYYGGAILNRTKHR